MQRRFIAVAAWCIMSIAPAVLLPAPGCTPAEKEHVYRKPLVTDRVKEVCSDHVRLVWMQKRASCTDKGDSDMYSPDEWVLGGYDSRDGKGQRVLCDKRQGYFMPMLTSDGRRVVFNDAETGTVRVVDFDGGNQRTVCKGLALETWGDRRTGREYVFVQRGPHEGRKATQNPVYRVALDNPDESTVFWDHTPVMFNNFQLSRRGDRVAIEAPWPRCVSAEAKTGTWRMFGQGCYPSMAPDDSHLTWHMDGPHKNILMFTPTGNTWWRIPMNDIPRFHKEKIGQPRWSNHVQYIVMVGPRPEGKKDDPVEEDDSEVYLGRFSGNFRQIEAWARVTHDQRKAMFPDAWVATGPVANAPKLPDRQVKTDPKYLAARQWPGSKDGLVFLWDNARAASRFTDDETGEIISDMPDPNALATYGPGYSMDCWGGQFISSDAGKRISRRCAAANAVTVEIVVTPRGMGNENDGAILTLQDGKEWRTNNLLLEQWRGEFHMYLLRWKDHEGTHGNWMKLGDIDGTRPHHILVTACDKYIKAFVDGRRTLVDVDRKVKFPTAWEPRTLRVGAVEKGDWDFTGLVRSVAIWDRPMTDAEARHHYDIARRRLVDWKIPRQVKVRAKLIEATPTPSKRDIGRYHRALVHYLYEVREVLSGKLDADRVIVAHWAIMDDEVVESIGQRKVGQTYTLTVEPMDEHPELSSEWTVAGLDEIDAPMYYDPWRVPLDLRTDIEKFRDAILACEPERVQVMIDKHPEFVNRPLEVEDLLWEPLPADLAADQCARWRSEGFDVFKKIVAAGGKANIGDYARAGQLDEVKKLLQADPNLLTWKDSQGRTPYYRSACSMSWDRQVEKVAEYLREQGAGPDLFDACFHTEIEVVRKMLQQDPNAARAIDPYGNTTLIWATRPRDRGGKTVDLVKLLIDHGADVNRAEKVGWRFAPLHFVCDWWSYKSPERTELAKILLDAGAQINAPAKPGYTPLDLARRRSRTKLTELLKSRGGKKGTAVDDE